MRNGGPAFPVTPEYDSGDNECITYFGMSLRDWFAGMALAGMHARDSYDEGQATPEQRAGLAYIDADAMLDEREKAHE